MTLIRTAGVTLAIAAALLLGEVAAVSHAAKLSHKDAIAACRAQYGKKVINAIVHKNGSVTCQWQVVRAMTRAEAYEACQKKFGPTTIMMQRTKAGWRCRYMERY